MTATSRRHGSIFKHYFLIDKKFQIIQNYYSLPLGSNGQQELLKRTEADRRRRKIVFVHIVGNLTVKNNRKTAQIIIDFLR